MKSTPNKTDPLTVHVAVAVLRYGDEFLLARRSLHQHLGGKLEFVGGKIQTDESPALAVVREVHEEIGLKLNTDQLVFMGKIAHDYADKSVCLHIYQACLTDCQYGDFRHRSVGLENQSLYWFKQDEIIARAHELPAANARILDWLSLPKVLYISQALSEFGGMEKFANYYIQHLPKGACFYLRPCISAHEVVKLLALMTESRADLRLVVGWSAYHAYHQQGTDVKDLMVKLTRAELDQFNAHDLPADLPIWVGVHDEKEARAVNQLNKSHRVLAALISPVRPTATHPKTPALGWEGFWHLAQLCDVPSFALGGMRLSDLQSAKDHGAIGIAGIRGVI